MLKTVNWNRLENLFHQFGDSNCAIGIYHDMQCVMFRYFKDVPLIDELIEKMFDNGFNWQYNNWNTYLNTYYGLNIDIVFKWFIGKMLLEFGNSNDMDIFILHFMQ